MAKEGLGPGGGVGAACCTSEPMYQVVPGCTRGPGGLSAYQFACFAAIYDVSRVMKVSNLLSIFL